MDEKKKKRTPNPAYNLREWLPKLGVSEVDIEILVRRHKYYWKRDGQFWKWDRIG